MRFSRHAVSKLQYLPQRVVQCFICRDLRKEKAAVELQESQSTPGTRGRGTGSRRAREDYDQNPPTDAPSPKRITRQRVSSTNAETQPPPLTEADIPRIVNAVLQGLPGTTVPSTSWPDEEGDPEHFNYECVLCIVIRMML